MLKPPEGASSLPLPLPHVPLLAGLQAQSCPAQEAADKLREAVLKGTLCASSAPAQADQVSLCECQIAALRGEAAGIIAIAQCSDPADIRKSDEASRQTPGVLALATLMDTLERGRQLWLWQLLSSTYIAPGLAGPKLTLCLAAWAPYKGLCKVPYEQVGVGKAHASWPASDWRQRRRQGRCLLPFSCQLLTGSPMHLLRTE